MQRLKRSIAHLKKREALFEHIRTDQQNKNKALAEQFQHLSRKFNSTEPAEIESQYQQLSLGKQSATNKYVETARNILDLFKQKEHLRREKETLQREAEMSLKAQRETIATL